MKSFAKSDTGQAMGQLNSRLKSIEDHMSSNKSEYSGCSDDEFEDEEVILGLLKHSRKNTGNRGQEDMPVHPTRSRGRTSSGSSGSMKYAGGSNLTGSVAKVVWQLTQQLKVLEEDVGHNRLVASDAYIAATGKSFGSKNMDSAGGNIGLGAVLKEQEQDIKTLTRRLKQLGDNTSKACRSLSTGLTDVQQASLYLYAWCDKAHNAFGTLSTHQGLSKNVCPRVQVYRSGLSIGDVNVGV